jgi:hypothetical protein
VNRVVKNIRLLSCLFILNFAGTGLSAKTLREMAQTSNLLLVLSERVGSGDSEVKKRSCGMSYKQLSARSQKLKSQIDQKIETLSANDYKVLERRIGSCEQDCTCDIYALAFEKIDKPNEALNQKAAQLTIENREKCVAQIKKICSRVQF